MNNTVASDNKPIIENAEKPEEDLVGSRLRILRISQGFSLRSLAERSGLNINTLSMIENSKSSPSISTLQQISIALNIPIIKFFESKPQSKKVVFTPANNRPKAFFGSTLMENLGKDLQENSVQPFVVNLKPGMGSGDKPIVHTGHEFVYCLAGKLQYQIDNEEYNLSIGDSLVFQAHLPHSWRNIGSETTRLLLVLFPADSKEEPGGRHFTNDQAKRRST